MQEEIEMLGDDIGQFIISDFDVKKDANTHPAKLPGFLKDLLVTKPVIVEEGCVKCGICIEVCPVVPKVLAWSDEVRNKPPVYDYKRCIRCYCCQEMCPEGTIVLKVPAVRRAMSWRKTTCRR